MSKFKLKISSRILKKKVRKSSFSNPKHCRFCTSKEQDALIDYKNTGLLRSFLTERYKILPAKVSGNCSFHQRKLANHIKIARSMALLPFCALHR